MTSSAPSRERFDLLGSYQSSFVTGNVTTIAAGTATAGFLFSMRFATATTPAQSLLVRSIEVEFLLTTAFAAAQEVGYDVVIARSYSASPTGGTAQTLAAGDGRKRAGNLANPFSVAGDVRTASASAIVAGTQVLDGQSVARGSFWAAAIGARLYDPHPLDFSGIDGGIVLAGNEGLIVRNTVLMGATGVGAWKFTVGYDLIIPA